MPKYPNSGKAWLSTNEPWPCSDRASEERDEFPSPHGLELSRHDFTSWTIVRGCRAVATRAEHPNVPHSQLPLSRPICDADAAHTGWDEICASGRSVAVPLLRRFRTRLGHLTILNRGRTRDTDGPDNFAINNEW